MNHFVRKNGKVLLYKLQILSNNLYYSKSCQDLTPSVNHKIAKNLKNRKIIKLRIDG